MSDALDDLDTRVLTSSAPTLLATDVLAPTGDKGRWADEIAGSGYACGACAEPLPIGALVCAHCGTILAFDDEDPIESGAGGPALGEETVVLTGIPDHRGVGRWIVLVLVVSMVVGAGTLWLRPGSTMSATADRAALTDKPAASPRPTVAPPSTTDARTASFCEGVRRYPLTNLGAFAAQVVADPAGTWQAYVTLSGSAPSDATGAVTALGPLTEQARDLVAAGQAPTAEAFGAWLAAPDQAPTVQRWVEGQAALAPVATSTCS